MPVAANSNVFNKKLVLCSFNQLTNKSNFHLHYENVMAAMTINVSGCYI